MNHGRHLIVCCDGTNNIWGHGEDVSNVVKLFKRLNVNAHQVLYYDPGVGTAESSIHESENLRAKFARVAGLAWGNGAWKNVAEAYAWLVRHYQEGDRIYLIGFSRGAFTVRALAGVLHWFQLIKPQNEAMIPSLIRAYRTKSDADRREAALSIRQHFSRYANWQTPGFPIEAIAVFDTVESVGFNQLLMGTQVHSDNLLKAEVRFARHAVALDETRWAYEPRLYEGLQDQNGEFINDIDGVPRLKQVAFTGAHCDVGGCYAETGLSDLALAWMIEELENLPPESALEFIPDWIQTLHPDPRGPRHDEILNMPLWALTGRVRRRFLRPRRESSTLKTLLRDRHLGPLQHLKIHRAAWERWQKTDWQPPIQPLAEEDRDLEDYGPKLAARLQALATTRTETASAKAPEQAVSTQRTWLWFLQSLLAFVAFAIWYNRPELLIPPLNVTGASLIDSTYALLTAITPSPTAGLKVLLDTVLMIPICVVLLTTLQVLTLQAQQESRLLGIWGCRTIGLYVLADLAENLMTVIRINAFPGEPGSDLVLGFRQTTWHLLITYLESLAEFFKLAGFGLALLIVVFALAQAAGRVFARRQGQPWQQLRDTTLVAGG